MIQRTARDYEVSLWSLQDSFIAILKQYGLEYKGQIQNGKLTDKDDGTQLFSFTIPMYLYNGTERVENPSWYNVISGNLLVNMRKIKVIFNKDALDMKNKKIYEFLIVKVKEKHENGELFCDVECLGLAFHELGKIGYKISLAADDFYEDDYNWAVNGKWIDSYGNEQTTQPLATLNYWNDKVFSTINNWTYELQMNWDSHSLYLFEKSGVRDDYVVTNDIIAIMQTRKSDKLYEDDFVDSWKNDNEGNLVPAHVTAAREKARIGVEINESNIYNITQTLAEIFGVFCKYVYEYDENFHIIGRKVVYYNNFLNEQDGLIDLNYKYQTSSIHREIDSTDLVTKLFVKGVENDASDSGITSIINVDANKSQEDYILNFDYLYKTGGITKLQYNKVEEYILKIRNYNERISPLSTKIISLQSQLPKLLAELTLRTNAIAQDTLQIFANGELLNAITNNTLVLSITKSNPQTAVLIKDTNKSYNSYYVKITQKGVYGESIHLYKSYNYSRAQLLNEIFTGQVEYDEFGNVIKISNLYIDETLSKTVYLIYDYRPALYYERIQDMWKSRLVEDEARKAELEKLLAKINYSLYGLNHLYSMENVEISSIKDVDIYTKYQAVLKLKQNLIKLFNLIMGPAIREGYWQPENYADYGDKHTDSLRIGSGYIGHNNASMGSSGNVSFAWDDELFDGLQQLYYEYSGEQRKIAYPCINLEKHPEIILLIQNNMDNNVCFYYNARTSVEDTPYARERPAVIEAPKYLYLIKNLYSLNTTTGEKVLNTTIANNYTDFLLNYSTYLGKLRQEWTDQSYRKGYSTFYWQIKLPDSDNWSNITYYSDDPTKNFGDPDKYTEYVLLGMFPYIQFTNNENYPQEIQIFETDTVSFEGCQFRLIIKNNKGMNLNNNTLWYNGITVEPTTIKLLNNEIGYKPIDLHKSRPLYHADPTAFFNIPITFRPSEEALLDLTAIFTLQYARDITGNDLSLDSWVNNNDTFSTNSWVTLDTNANNSVYILPYRQTDEETIIYKKEEDGSVSFNIRFNIDQLNFNVLTSDEWRFRLYIRNAQDHINGINSYVESEYARIYIADAYPYYSHADITKTYVDLTKSCEFELKIYYDLPAAQFGVNEVYIPLQYQIDSILWKKIDRTITGATATDITLGTTDDISDNITITSLNTPDTKLHKFYLTLNITSTSGQINDNIINKFITNWDGFGIYSLVTNKSHQNMKVPNNYNLLFTLDGYCPIVITSQLQPTLIYPIRNVQNNTVSDDYSITIEGTNITKYEWSIILFNGTKYNLNNDTQSLTVSDNIYTSSLLNNSKVKLNITIPRVSDNSATFDKATLNTGAQIYCKVWNESNKYSSVVPSDSYILSNICYVQALSLFNVYQLSLLNITVKYWWPCLNPAGTFIKNFGYPFAIGVKNIFNQSHLALENALTVTVEQSDVVNLHDLALMNDELSIPNNLQFHTPDSNFPPYAQILNSASDEFDTISENTYYSIKTLMINPPNSYLDWNNVVHTDTSNYDKWFAYFYKITISYSDTRVLASSKVCYVKVIIRQSPPEFLPNSVWKPETNWPAGEYLTDDNVEIECYSTSVSIGKTTGNKYGFINGSTLVRCDNQIIYAKNFGFNNASVEKYYWKLNVWHTRATSIKNNLHVPIGNEYQGLQEVREMALKYKSPLIISPLGFIYSLFDDSLNGGSDSSSNITADAIRTAIFNLIAYGDIQSVTGPTLIPSIGCDIVEYKTAATPTSLNVDIYSVPNGILDSFHKRDTAIYNLMCAGLHRNLYLLASNPWGTTRSKTWQAKFKYNSINSSQSLVHVYDSTKEKENERKYYDILNEGYQRS